MAALLAIAVSMPAAAQVPDELMAPINRMLDGMRTKDSALMASAFTREARLYGMRRRRDGTEVVQVLHADSFVVAMLRDRREAWTERLSNARYEMNGTLATVWADYTFHFGTTFSHCGVDAFSLLRTPDGWRIATITDTYVTEGCS